MLMNYAAYRTLQGEKASLAHKLADPEADLIDVDFLRCPIADREELF